jgi:hypothetical protein
MKIKFVLSVILGLSLMGSWLQAAEENPVFKSVKYGIFAHHAWGGTAYSLTKNPDLSVPKSIDEVADSFDIKRFVKDLQAFRPDYISFTAWHACMNPIFPCAAMDKWRGKGHAARRDVMGELIHELKPTGIKLFLYIHPSDGHDMTKQDQMLLGWNESINQGKGWKAGMYVKWNNFMNEVFDEMCARYGKDVCGYWVDGGWERIDVKRLKETVWKYNPKAEFVSGMDNAGWCNQFNRMIPPAPEKGIPAATPNNADTWPCFEANVNLLQGGCWWTTGGWAKTSPEHMLRYTVLQAGCNTQGGGAGWAADTYTDGTWEPMVREYFMILGQLIKPIEESIKNTRPSNSFITPQGSRIVTLPYGIVATMATDGVYEYIHVLRPPTGTNEATRQRYVSRLNLPPPIDFKKFTKAVMLRSGREAILKQDDKGVRIDVPWQDAWDPIDTVIKLTVEPGYGLLSLGQTVTMSGEETPGWSPKNLVDGNKNTCWNSAKSKPGEAPWVMIDLGDVACLTRVHLFSRVVNNKVGCNFPVDFEFSVSSDGQSFVKVLAVTDYQVRSPRSNETAYVWDPGLNDYKKAEPGNETEDLSLSGSGAKSSADYPQYFALPEGTKGRYLKITGTKLGREGSMQFSEIEVFGSKEKFSSK